MNLLDALRRRQQTAVTLYDYEGKDMGVDGDIVVNGHKREVALFRPPVVLGRDGESLPGVDRQLVATYLVSTTGMLAEVDLGPVRVDWKERVGRFATATLNMETWGQSLTVLIPVHVISSQLEGILAMYQEAVCEKARQIHKGHQSYAKPNQLLRRAAKQLERLRDEPHPHVTDGEYLFLAGNLAQAQVMNALVPLPVGDGEQVIGQTTRVEPADKRLPSGG